MIARIVLVVLMAVMFILIGLLLAVTMQPFMDISRKIQMILAIIGSIILGILVGQWVKRKSLTSW